MTITLKKIVCLIGVLFSSIVFSHPLPNTVVNLNIQSHGMIMNLQMPLQDFEIACHYKVKSSKEVTKSFFNYFSKHIQIEDKQHHFWKMEFVDYQIQTAKAALVGSYKEIQFKLKFTPNTISNCRDFTLHYDAILHEIANHQALIYVNSDWENGIHNESQQIGIVALDVPTNQIYPLHISLAPGSSWKGFKSMVHLGIQHISEGADHVLFLLVLLLSAPLISHNRKWVATGKIKYSILRILKIATAFTIGHSITLVVGALGFFRPNTQWVEVLIAISILIAAVHALWPIFPKKELYIASGFGLIHGLAFATILTELHLDSYKLTLSLLGFNIGIEIMQLFIIIIVMPWLLLLSSYKLYKWIRIFGACFAAVASVSWILENFMKRPNLISVFIQYCTSHAFWLLGFLACFSIVYKMMKRK